MNANQRPATVSGLPRSYDARHGDSLRNTPSQRLTANWEANRSSLLDCALAVTGCRDGAEDVVQSAFLRLWEHRNLDHIREGDRFLFRVVRNMAIDWYRARSREQKVCISGIEGVSDAGVQTITPEDSVEGSRSLRQVMQTLSDLPGRMQNVLVMTRLEGLTQREVARRLDVSPTLVNFMLRDGVQHCRDSLSRPH